jgi:prepilin-type N-terminal cleavage/methylation domain-containing protein
MAMRNRKQDGFSLIEMMIVLAILALVMGVTMTAINDVQKRARVEEAKVDLNQESREFVEQIVRDLHGAGFPTPNMYQATLATSSSQVAAGLVAATTTSIWFEGDMDRDGVVDVVQYQLISDPANAVGGRCPCILQRGQIPKVDGVAPLAQPAPAFTTEVDGIINSGGPGAALAIDGSFRAIDNATVVQNDTYYAPYKLDPIFRYFNGIGNELRPIGGGNFTEIPDVSACLSAGCASTLADVRSVRINVNTLSRVTDPITHTFPVNQQKSAARISNR